MSQATEHHTALKRKTVLIFKDKFCFTGNTGAFMVITLVCLFFIKIPGLVRDLNPGPLAPKARIIPLDQRATLLTHNLQTWMYTNHQLFYQRNKVNNEWRGSKVHMMHHASKHITSWSSDCHLMPPLPRWHNRLARRTYSQYLLAMSHAEVVSSSLTRGTVLCNLSSQVIQNYADKFETFQTNIRQWKGLEDVVQMLH